MGESRVRPEARNRALQSICDCGRGRYSTGIARDRRLRPLDIARATELSVQRACVEPRDGGRALARYSCDRRRSYHVEAKRSLQPRHPLRLVYAESGPPCRCQPESRERQLDPRGSSPGIQILDGSQGIFKPRCGSLRHGIVALRFGEGARRPIFVDTRDLIARWPVRI